MILMTSARTIRFIRNGHTCPGLAGPTGLILSASGHNDTLLWSHNPASGAGQFHSWSAWGNGHISDGLPGFNGERSDPVSGCYHLGNGYRTYDPVLRRFNSPDNLSPFASGGINPYAYCAGDPVNHTDPTGHISWQGIVGIVGGVIGLGLSLFTAGASIAVAGSVAAAVSSASTTALIAGGVGVAADVTAIASGALEDSAPETSTVLGWVSMATGLTGLVNATSHTSSFFKTPRKKIVDYTPIPHAKILSSQNSIRRKNINLNRLLKSHTSINDIHMMDIHERNLARRVVSFNENDEIIIFNTSNTAHVNNELLSSSIDDGVRELNDTAIENKLSFTKKNAIHNSASSHNNQYLTPVNFKKSLNIIGDSYFCVPL